MNPLDLLQNIKNGLTGYFSPKVNTPVPIDQYMGKNATKGQDAILPGENQWVAMMLNKGDAHSAADLHTLYKKGVNSPGGQYYKQEMKVQMRPSLAAKGQTEMSPNAPQPLPTDIPGLAKKDPKALVAAVSKLYQSRAPGGQALNDYYPIAPHLEQIIQRGEGIRPGLGVLAALQAFYESTGGRGGGNYWGILPGGEANPSSGNRVAAMDTNKQMDYLFGPQVLGGGANPNMNVASGSDTTPLNVSRIKQLYQSYNPDGAYLPNLLSDYTQVMGGR